MPHPHRGRILLVEDDFQLQGMLLTALVNEGFSVLTVDNGQQALDVLERGVRPGLMLLDLALPRVSGIDVLDYIRRDPEHRSIPTIVVSETLGNRRRVVDGADAVFEKPLDLPDLVATVRDLLRDA